MPPNKSYNFNQPKRQSPIAIFLIIQKLIEQIIRQFWPLLLVVVLNNLDFQTKGNSANEDPYITRILFVIGGLSAIGSIIAYFKFYYYIKNDEFVIEKGLFQKKKINIPFDRIQTINFEQNLIHQAFNVVSLEIDSAGSNLKEISIQAIRREEAEAIRAFIMAEKAKKQPTSFQEIPEISLEETPTDALMHLTPFDLIKVGISQNHIRGLGIILGFGFWIFQTVVDIDFLDRNNPVDYLEKDLGLTSLFSLWVYFLVALIIISILISLVLTVFQYYDLRFFKSNTGFKVVSGLFTKREESASINKIQLIRWKDTILKRMFKIFELGLFQASSAAINIRQSINIPGCYIDQINTVRATYFPEEANLNYSTHQISPLIIGRRVLYLGGIPSLIFIINAYFHHSLYFGVLTLIWPIGIFFTSKIFHKNWKFHISKEGLLTEHGIIGTQFTLLKWYKVQAVKTRQSIYQTKKNVADLYFYTAAGTVKIPYVPLTIAQEITNYVLYKVEIDERSWM